MKYGVSWRRTSEWSGGAVSAALLNWCVLPVKAAMMCSSSRVCGSGFNLMIHCEGSTMKSMKSLGALVLSLVSTVAMAHAHLQKAVPADGAVVTASPANVVLSFSEPAHLTACWIQK